MLYFQNYCRILANVDVNMVPPDISDELVEGIDIGQDCSVIGLPLFEQKSKTVSMEVFMVTFFLFLKNSVLRRIPLLNCCPDCSDT